MEDLLNNLLNWRIESYTATQQKIHHKLAQGHGNGNQKSQNDQQRNANHKIYSTQVNKKKGSKKKYVKKRKIKNLENLHRENVTSVNVKDTSFGNADHLKPWIQMRDLNLSKTTNYAEYLLVTQQTNSAKAHRNV